MIEIRNKLTKVSTVIEDNAKVPEGWTDKPPKWVPFEGWDETAGDWTVDAVAKSNAAINVQIADIEAQIKVIEDTQTRQVREITLGLDTNGTAKTKLTESNTAISALRSQRATLTASLK